MIFGITTYNGYISVSKRNTKLILQIYSAQKL